MYASSYSYGHYAYAYIPIIGVTSINITRTTGGNPSSLSAYIMQSDGNTVNISSGTYTYTCSDGFLYIYAFLQVDKSNANLLLICNSIS